MRFGSFAAAALIIASTIAARSALAESSSAPDTRECQAALVTGLSPSNKHQESSAANQFSQLLHRLIIARDALSSDVLEKLLKSAEPINPLTGNNVRLDAQNRLAFDRAFDRVLKEKIEWDLVKEDLKRFIATKEQNKDNRSQATTDTAGIFEPFWLDRITVTEKPYMNFPTGGHNPRARGVPGYTSYTSADGKDWFFVNLETGNFTRLESEAKPIYGDYGKGVRLFKMNDGKVVVPVVAADHNGIRLFDVNTGEQTLLANLSEIDGIRPFHGSFVEAGLFASRNSSNEFELVIVLGREATRVNLTTKKAVQLSLPDAENNIVSTENGIYAVSTQNQDRVTVTDILNNKILFDEVITSQYGDIMKGDLHQTADGRLYASASTAGEFHIIDVTNKKVSHFGSEPINSRADPKSFGTWYFTKMLPFESSRGHTEAVIGTIWKPLGPPSQFGTLSLLVAELETGSLREVLIEENVYKTSLQTFQQLDDGQAQGGLTGDRAFLVAGGFDGQIWVIDLHTGENKGIKGKGSSQVLYNIYKDERNALVAVFGPKYTNHPLEPIQLFGPATKRRSR